MSDDFYIACSTCKERMFLKTACIRPNAIAFFVLKHAEDAYCELLVLQSSGMTFDQFDYRELDGSWAECQRDEMFERLNGKNNDGFKGES